VVEGVREEEEVLEKLKMSERGQETREMSTTPKVEV